MEGRTGSATVGEGPEPARAHRARQASAAAHVVEDRVDAHAARGRVVVVLRGRELDLPALRGERAREFGGVVGDAALPGLLDHEHSTSHPKIIPYRCDPLVEPRTRVGARRAARTSPYR